MMLADRVAIVTGAAQGIGAAVAAAYVKEGARVFIVNRDRTAATSAWIAASGAFQARTPQGTTWMRSGGVSG